MHDELLGATEIDDIGAVEVMLEMHFPENSPLSLREFMDVEALLALSVEVGAQIDADKLNRLLANYPLLRPESFGKAEHLMQMGRRHLLHLSSTGAWQRLLGEYCEDSLKDLRLFDVVENRVVPRELSQGSLDRQGAYIDKLMSEPKLGGTYSMAKPGGKYRYFALPEAAAGEHAKGHSREAHIPQGAKELDLPFEFAERKGPLEPIAITLDELIGTAREISEKTGKTHYAAVLEEVKERGLLKYVLGPESEPADCIELEQVVSLVGIVGAGKSVLANTLVVALAKRGNRVVSLFNSIADVMENVLFLRKAGIAASPLISKSRRVEHLGNLFHESEAMLLEDDVARYLETPCLIDGLEMTERDACSYDTVPCTSLRKGKNSYVCPYWDVCPSLAMLREAADSQVIVTTPNGFTMMTADKDRKAFFELALKGVDVVIFDEADRVQVQLDSTFAPELSFQELIYHSADVTAEAMKRDPSKKMMDYNEELYFDLRQSTEPVAKALLKSVRNKAVSGWKVVKKEAFTSLTLLDSLEDDGLPSPIVDDLSARISRKREKNPLLDQVLETSCQGVDDTTFKRAFDTYLTARMEEGVELSEEMRERLAFALKVIRFDEFLISLANASDFMSFRDESMAKLYNFLRFGHVRQQRYLPSSLIGNLFGMRLTDDNDLLLYRQFGFGRSFMNSLPWFITDEEGRPSGPHTLLLSGSSWAPGCLQCHINRPVKYLLEAQPWKAEKLAQSVVKDLGIAQFVSGSGRKERPLHLKDVLGELFTTLCSELDEDEAGKALVIVNSYAEASDARIKLENLMRRNGRTDAVCALTNEGVKDPEAFVPRSEVSLFHWHPARVLVAPAMAIERGYNIVDELGHATFTSAFFAVRPMGMPRDIGARFRRLNGLVERSVGELSEDPGEYADALRAKAWREWKHMERAENQPMSCWQAMDAEYLLEDVTATLLTTIIQIFGRLARLEDPTRRPPHIYFADAAFRGKEPEEGKKIRPVRTLGELGAYMEKLMTQSEQPEVARALYGPFYEAFKKGVDNV